MKTVVQQWYAHPAVRAALADLADYRPTLATAIEIQQVPAPTFAERPRSVLVSQRMQALGLHDVEIDELGNVYGRRPGIVERPALLISAHLDTVFPADTDLSIRYEGERVYGPGIGDNSVGVAGLLRLAEIYQRCDLPMQGDIWFVANVGEEGLGDLRGMRAVVERLRTRIGGVIVIEGCDFGSLHHQAIGVRRFRIEARGPGGHSWGNFGTPSAIHVLVRLAARLTELQVPVSPRTTFNIGMISGGTSVNTIAHYASMLLDLRSVSSAVLSDLVSEVYRLVEEATLDQPEVHLQIIKVGDRPSGAIPREHPLVQAAVAAYQMVGAQISFQQSSTDANIPLSLGIPAICVGLTDGGNAHRTDEYILPTNLGRGMQALLLLSLAANTLDMP
ncbi:MAG: M20/M25/M40 family metallo-hydrolase [Chloroflexus sp.]|jgi:acetylornithine deacetylase/succinyl-diaminopimelate desuccinylase-like protein|uniref:M20/M25/M40 family metallo-hydrolase n=1 Tax=Chloroflexus sp. Y-396-1 TaxID=867845 RepID=UPI00048CB4A9|nr:M20/M25/M40 family metallo-hydrolase [Chloroflexus sp. Y-396-1]MBO9318325.1 M20/M25/M40 family metallo-hydrolase [Chloroflexus sp.]MBO9339148.1 M20/M25/M40 family metallo-hydrolase [Chloroflexus sp.]